MSPKVEPGYNWCYWQAMTGTFIFCCSDVSKEVLFKRTQVGGGVEGTFHLWRLDVSYRRLKSSQTFDRRKTCL